MIAAIHQANKMMDLSQQANQKMQALWTECDDDRLNALGLREVANLHLDREEPEEALKVANEARSLAKKSQNKYFEVEMLMVVADAQMACLHKIEQDTKKPAARSVLEKAMKVTKEAIVLAKKAGDKTILGWAQLKLSQMYLCHGRIEDAIKASDDASKNFKANGHEARGEILCMLSSAQAYFHLDDMSKATDLSHKAIEKAKASIDPEHEYAANEILQAIQAKQGGGRPQQHQEVEQDSMPQQSVQQIQSSAQPLAKPALDPVVVTQMVRETLAASVGSDDGDPYFGELKGVVFCAEEAVLPAEFVTRVLDFEDGGKSAFADGYPARAICCLPVSNKVVKEKAANWIPIFNNDRKKEEMWKKFETTYKNHPSFTDAGGNASILRFGSLLGGSFDGPPNLKDYGLDEGMYKMSLEQYRDMRERAFDRYKLSAQVLAGDSINPKPNDQESKEKDALSKLPGSVREMFTILGEYPEIDRSNRHTVASALVQLLMRPADESVAGPCAKECTVLSKAASELPTPEEWIGMFENPSTAAWPDPYKFDPELYGLAIEEANK